MERMRMIEGPGENLMEEREKNCLSVGKDEDLIPGKRAKSVFLDWSSCKN